MWVSFALFYIYKGAFDSLILWFVLPLMYAPLVYLSWRSNYLMLFLFVLISTATNAVTPAHFFFNKNDYATWGWNSVNRFEFVIGDYLYINNLLWFFLIIVVLASLLINKTILMIPTCKSILYKVNSETKSESKISLSTSKLPVSITIGNNKANKNLTLYGSALFIFIIILSILNSWMFGRGMSITGLTAAQELLPFKLNGILYYFTRFIVPVIIYYLYSHSSKSLKLTTLIVLYAAFAGLSQLSRTTFILILFTAIYFPLKEQKYYSLSVIGILSLFLLSVITQARNFVYLVVGGVATKGYESGLISLMGNVLSKLEDFDLNAVFFSMLNRVGGAQDIVLGFQYDTDAMGGYWANFSRIFLFNSELNESAHQALYGFIPPYGFATGSGGFSSQVLQIAGGNLLVLCFVAFWVASWVSLGDKIICAYVRIFKGLNIAIVFAFFFIFLFFASGHMAWFYSFIGIALFVAICGRNPISLRRRVMAPLTL